ncbi:MAG: phosphoglucomutase/phosphomannomutase family protein [Saprospiraceae bacterium]|nr:phosphoglucomutase/phosphomannomutase family protein [Saprospiraceae bacterium]
MTKIKFGTDGWRAIIAQEFTVDNVMRVAYASAQWLKSRGKTKVVIGFDCRFGGRLFTESAARVLAENGMHVFMAPEFVSTPMVSLGVVKLQADLGVVITASHNPPSYNGYKLKSKLGGPMIPAEVAEVEALIPDSVPAQPNSFDHYLEQGAIEYVALEDIYVAHAEAYFDLDAISKLPQKVAYDAMFGAGQNAMRRLLPNAVFLHSEYNPSFLGQAPEPIHRNLTELSDLIAGDDSIGCGIANDGDADRIGMYDGHGKFIDSHHLLLLLLYYMKEIKGETGKVIITFSVTEKMKKLAQQYGLDFEVTKIGFKYIAEIMAQEDVIVGGEESGGLAVKGHIPERDGIWNGLIILEFMAKTGKSLEELIQVIYSKVGSFAFDRDDLHVTEELKAEILQACIDRKYKNFGSYTVQNVEDLDGFKFHLDENSWVMIRPSGTEPVLRVYSQAPTDADVRKILDATGATILPA